MEALQDSIGRLLSPFSSSLPSPRQLLQLSLFSPLIIQQQKPSPPAQTDIQPSQGTCPSPSLSCPAPPPDDPDTCCLNHPSGHFLLAQFWDTHPALGPRDSWTLHGLWPDRCTGGYDANCDASRALGTRQIDDIVRRSAASSASGRDLVEYMDAYWKGLHGDADLWAHEWNKHGTCVSTLEPRCYRRDSHSPYPPTVDDDDDDDDDDHADVLDYFAAATALHATLDTHGRLAAAGIVPSATARYTLAAVEAALSLTRHPVWSSSSSSLLPRDVTYTATVKCRGGGDVLDEVWMHFGTAGALRNTTADNVRDRFRPVGPDGRGNCPATGIRYLPKDRALEPGPTPTSTRPVPGPGPTGGAAPFEGRGFLRVRVLGSAEQGGGGGEGCLIRLGGWYVSGQCATYRATPDVVPSHDDDDDDDGKLFTLASSFAPCAVLEMNGKPGDHGQFVCGRRLPVQSIFGVGKSSEGGDESEQADVLSWRNQTVFYAIKVPERFEKVPIFTDDGGGERNVKLEIYWQSV